MKKKIQIGPFKFKISYKNNRWLDLFKSKQVFKEFVYTKPDPAKLLEYKIYRIFKQEYCEFFPGNKYGVNGTEPSSLVYYINKQNDSLNNSKYLIGEFMFGEDKIEFFKRKNIFIRETLKEYSIVQEDFVLATYDKEWINKQGVYQ